LVAEDGVIVAVGDLDECTAAAGASAERVDLEGGYVYPGFTDSHVHLANAAREMTMVDLRSATSYEQALDDVAHFARNCGPDDWILGGRWSHHGWTPVQWPHRSGLDVATQGRPAALASLDGHSIWANSAALARLGIDARTPDPVGGRIMRDETGEPTGILQERATEAARQLWATQGDTDLHMLLPAAFERALSAGLTSIHDFDGVDAIEAFSALHADGRLPLRVLKSVPVAHLETAIAAGWRTGRGDTWLRQGAVKIFADGALGSRSAAMIRAYRDEPGNRGIVRTPPDEIAAITELAGRHGIAAAIHAIGDQANRIVLDVFEQQQDLGGHSLRHRVEHAQHVAEEDLIRFARLGVIASMQPAHCVDDMDMVVDALAPEVLSYPWRTLLDDGATLAFGSDAPVGPLDPLLGIHAAVSRQDLHALPPSGFQPHERITVTEALRAYTAGPAWASGEENVKGRLAVGMLADFVVLSDDVISTDVHMIPKIQVHRTVVAGTSQWTS